MKKEIGLLEECWRRLAVNGPVAYGKDQLQKALEEGAVETLLISADLLRSEDKINGKSWTKWVDGLADINATVQQCSTEHDAGQQLLGFGGAVALLRFKM